MSLLIKALIGALMVVLIAILSKTKNYYLAGLIPLFPTFALIAHYIVGTERSTIELKPTILFSMWSLIPLPAFSLYSDRQTQTGSSPHFRRTDMGLRSRHIGFFVDENSGLKDHWIVRQEFWQSKCLKSIFFPIQAASSQTTTAVYKTTSRL